MRVISLSGEGKKKGAKGQRKKAAKKQQVRKPEEDEEIQAEELLFARNPARSYILRDVWYRSLATVVSAEDIPEDKQRELMFLTLSNALLDMIMDIMPEELSVLLARNLDDYLAITVVNQQHNVDLLQSFQDEFAADRGSKFKDEKELDEALAEFEEKWWNAPRGELGGVSPNAAIEEVMERYDL